MKLKIFCFLFFINCTLIYSQVPTSQDCNGAIQVCQSVYTNTNSIVGEGNILNEINALPPVSNCLFSGEQNGVWYKFSVQNTGKLCFTIDPIVNTDDFDFALFNLTGSICTSIATTGSLSAACNYNAQTNWFNMGGTLDATNQGNTGLFETGTYNVTNIQANDCINVTTGSSYALYVSSASLPNNGYSLSFPPLGTPGMASVVDVTPPQLSSVVSSTNCGITSLSAVFSEDVLYSSIQLTDFQLTGPGGTYTINSITGINSGSGSTQDRTFIINFSPALNTGGTYQLCLNGSNVTDPCGNVAANGCLNFNITGPVSSFNSINSEICAGSSRTFTNTGNGTIHNWSFQGGSPASSTLLNPPAITWGTPGTYTVTHTETMGACISSTTGTVIVNPVPTSTVTLANPTCSTTTGAATLSVSGGTPTYTFSWVPLVSTSSSVTNLTPGTSHTVQVTDSKNCKSTKTLTVGPLINTSTAFNLSANRCLSGNTFTFSNTGTPLGTHSYSFSPTVGAPVALTGKTVTASFSAAGTYEVTHIVNIGVNCVFTQTAQVTVFPNPTSINSNTFNTVCSLPNGSITITGASGGSPGYQYNLNGGGFSNTLSYTGLSAGTYTVGVQDLNGCTFTNTAVIADVPGPTAITLTTTPASCNLNDGSIIINGTIGGTAPYVYSFNNGPYTATSPIIGLGAGGYNISVKDANNCTFTTSINVQNPLAPTAVVLTTTNTACVGNTGIIHIGAVTGGVPTYSYSLDGGPFTTNVNYSAQAFGNHSVIVKDGNNCTFNTSVNVAMETGPTSVSLTPTHISCGGINGAVNIGIVTGGIPTYSFSLNGGISSTNTSYTGLAAGVYTVTTTDGNGCQHVGTTTIIFNSNPTATVTNISNVLCNGGTSGSATITASAGTPGYTYSINPIGASNGTGFFSGISAGIYTVTVKDAANCTTTQTLLVTEPLPLTASILSQTNVSCFSGNDGAVTIFPKDGTGPYQYALNGGAYQTGSSFSSLTVGNYSVTVRDNNSCTYIQNVIITEPPVLTLVAGSSPANCNASDGVAVVTPSGGTPSYSYQWTGGGGTTATSNGVAPGNYTVTVTDSKGCVKTASVIVNVKGGAIVTIGSITNVSCFGFTNGSVVTSMSGIPSGPYSYTWAPSGGNSNTASNLAAGIYTVTALNVFGCRSTATVSVTQPTQLTAALTTTAATCNGGNDAKANLIASGGTSPYTYLWSPMGTTTNSIVNLAGSYSYSLTDFKGCVVTNTITLTQPNPVAIVPTFTLPGCGQANGAASINNSTTGGTGPYTYLWSNGTVGQVISNISAGTYTCTVTDFKLCIKSFPVSVVNPASPSVTVTTVTNVSCNGGNDGTATVLVSGGNPVYTYSWSTIPTQITPTAANLRAGNYNLNVTDANGCTASQAVTITEPLPLTVNTTSLNPKCVGNADGLATAFPNGGTSPYSYSWNSAPTQTTSAANGLQAGTYYVTVTDAKLCVKIETVTLSNPQPLTVNITSTNAACYNECNAIAKANVTNAVGLINYQWSDANNQRTETASFLCDGSYTVSVTDANNCLATGNITITEPSLLTSTITVFGNVSCYGGSNGYAQVNVSGGTAGYSYNWSNGANLGSINNLVANNYSVTVTDANNCTTNTQITIQEPSQLVATASGTNINCFGANDGEAVVNYVGGTGPYTFLWEPSLQTNYNASNLTPQTHTVTVRDNNNCLATSTVALTEPAIITVTATSVSSNCGQSNGSSCASVTGGVFPYAYLWSNGNVSSCNNGLAANLYTVQVTDAKNCTSVAQININDIAAPSVSITASSSLTCYQNNTGSATASYTGGVAPYTAIWTNTTYTTATISNLPAGVYNYQVTDGAGCIGASFVVIDEPTKLISLTSSSDNVKCFSVCTGSATTLVNGGIAPYTYNWSDINNQVNNSATFLCAGDYTCKVTDANNCEVTNTVTISEPSVLAINSVTTTSVSCYSLTDGGFAITPMGGTPGYSFTWTLTGGNNSIASGLSAGNYSVTLGDANGCLTTVSYTLVDPPQITAVSSTTNSTCFLANGKASVKASGGTPGYTYNWNTQIAQQTEAATNLLAGPWQCTITDSKGCSIVETLTVTNTQVPIINSITYTMPTCNGQLNGEIVVNGTPGITPTSYIWTGPVSQIATTNTLSGVGAGIYSVDVKDANNCITPGIVNVIQPSLLTLTVSAVSTICYGQSGQIYAAAIGGTPPYNYNWLPGNFLGAGPHVVSPLTSTIYPVTVTDANGCTVPGNQISLNVNPSLSAVSSNTVGCDGENIVITSNASGGNGGPYSYSWNNGVLTQTNTILADIALSPMTFSVLISDGCSSPITSSLTVTVNSKSTGSFSSNILAGCEDLYIVLSAVSSSTADTYSWNFGDGSAASTGSLVGHTYFNSGVFSPTLQITNSNGCISNVNRVNYIEVYPKPTAAFIANPNTTDIINSTIEFTDQSLLATSWDWSFGDLGSGQFNYSTLPSPSHDFNLAGEYDVTLLVTSVNGCKDAVLQRISITPEFVIYVPNAFTPNNNGKNEVFQPKGVGINEDQYQLTVYDRWGETIFTSNNFKVGWDGLIKSNTPAKEDVYVWQITVNDITGEQHKLTGHVTLIR